MWIGLHDRHLEAGCEETGFIWMDGTPTDFERWAQGEPNDWLEGEANCHNPGEHEVAGEDCVELTLELLAVGALDNAEVVCLEQALPSQAPMALGVPSASTCFAGAPLHELTLVATCWPHAVVA